MKMISSTRNIKDNKSMPFNNIFVRIILLSGIILFFQMMFLPRTYQLLAIPFLAICLIGTLFIISLYGKIKLDWGVFIWFLIYMSYGVVWGLLGLFNNKEFANDFLRLNVIWIFIYLLLVASISKGRYLEIFQKVMIWGALAVSLYNINYYFYSIDIINIAFLTTLEMGQRIGIHPGYVQITSHNLGSLCFLFPFLFSGLVINKGKKFVGYSSKFTFFVLLVSLLAIFISGRRALWIIVAITPVIYYIAILLSNSGRITIKQIVNLIIAFCIIFLSVQTIFFKMAGWDLQSFSDRLTFSGVHAEGSIYRVNKTKAMITEVFETNLFFGTGGGSPAFEMTFIQVFHETGIVGTSIFLGIFLWTFFMIIKLIREKRGEKEYGIPILVGSTCFFFSMWTNPYFGSFDFMWALFLPIAYINISLRNSKYESVIKRI